MKVYSGLLPKGLSKEEKGLINVRTIVAAKSLREASEIIGISLGALKDKMDLSADELENLIANQQPGTIFQSSGPRMTDYKPVKVDELHPVSIKTDQRPEKNQNLIQKYLEGLSFVDRKLC